MREERHFGVLVLFVYPEFFLFFPLKSRFFRKRWIVSVRDDRLQRGSYDRGLRLLWATILVYGFTTGYRYADSSICTEKCDVTNLLGGRDCGCKRNSTIELRLDHARVSLAAVQCTRQIIKYWDTYNPNPWLGAK